MLLPLGRVADMWLRPRVENLPIDLDWWVYKHHYAETRFSWFYAGLNALYLLLGIAGLCLRPRMWPWMLAYMRAAQRAAADGGGARGALYAGVLSDAVCAGRDCALPVYELGLAVGLEGEGVRGQGLIELDVEVDADARLALSLVEYLLQADAARRDPSRSSPSERFLRTVGVLGDQFQLFGLHAVQGLFATVLDVPFFCKLFAAGAEAEQQIALVSCRSCNVVTWFGSFSYKLKHAFENV